MYKYSDKNKKFVINTVTGEQIPVGHTKWYSEIKPWVDLGNEIEEYKDLNPKKDDPISLKGKSYDNEIDTLFHMIELAKYNNEFEVIIFDDKGNQQTVSFLEAETLLNQLRLRERNYLISKSSKKDKKPKVNNVFKG